MTQAICSVEGCGYSVRNKNNHLCHAHRERLRRTGSLMLHKPITRQRFVCSVPDCGRKHASLGYCTIHYDRLKKTGDVSADVPARIWRFTRVNSDGLRWCYTCEQWLIESEFTQTNVCSRCRQLTNYGMNRIEWDALFVSQGSACAICRSTEGGNGWHTDHDHSCCPLRKSCGKCVRGILCNGCNTGIGLLQDSAEILTAAAAYLEGHHNRA